MMSPGVNCHPWSLLMLLRASMRVLVDFQYHRCSWFPLFLVFFVSCVVFCVYRVSCKSRVSCVSCCHVSCVLCHVFCVLSCVSCRRLLRTPSFSARGSAPSHLKNDVKSTKTHLEDVGAHLGVHRRLVKYVLEINLWSLDEHIRTHRRCYLEHLNIPWDFNRLPTTTWLI